MTCKSSNFCNHKLIPPGWLLLLLLLSSEISSAQVPVPLPTFLPAAKRIVAIGDLHGDLDAARRVFLLAGITDSLDRWVAGNLVVVQTGVQLDRGDQEQALLLFLEDLQKQASAAGGALHLLNGNHELMNARLDLRYVTEGGFEDFQDAVDIPELDSLLLAFAPEQRARVAAFRPGGPYALKLARRNTILMIGKNLFVHGGVLPEHLDYGLEKLNREIQLWLAGTSSAPAGIHKSHSPTWTRIYSDHPDSTSCGVLTEVLQRLGADRMIVGHTVQDEGIQSYCQGQVWCIDAGLAEYYGSVSAALEIEGNRVTILTPLVSKSPK